MHVDIAGCLKMQCHLMMLCAFLYSIITQTIQLRSGHTQCHSPYYMYPNHLSIFSNNTYRLLFMLTCRFLQDPNSEQNDVEWLQRYDNSDTIIVDIILVPLYSIKKILLEILVVVLKACLIIFHVKQS